jgi:hypothetical protein
LTPKGQIFAGVPATQPDPGRLTPDVRRGYLSMLYLWNIRADLHLRRPSIH